MEEPKFEDWYHSEWNIHIRDAGGISAQIKLLTWMVGLLVTSQVAMFSTFAVLLTR